MSDENKRLSFYLEREEKNFEIHNAKYIAATELSSSFALLGVRSSFILNGGALFALAPLYVSLSDGPRSIDIHALYLPSSLFILGILFASACSAVAYINFQIMAEVSYFEMMKRDNLIQTLLEIHPTEFNFSQTEIKKKISFADNWMTRTAWIGLIFAILSFVGFFFGCFYSARLFLQGI